MGAVPGHPMKKWGSLSFLAVKEKIHLQNRAITSVIQT